MSNDVGRALPWERTVRSSRWFTLGVASRVAKLARVADHATRALGLASVVTRVGPAARQPMFHQALRRVGVLEKDPRSAVDSPLLGRLPWGGRTVEAPPPDKPSGVDGMWPQSPVFHPELYPSVLHLERKEIDEHVRTNALRYLGQIAALTPHAAWRARRGPRVLPLDEATFARILTETSLAQHVRHTLNAADEDAFAPQLAAAGEGVGWAKIDFSSVTPGPALPDVHLTPTVTLFRRHADGRFDVRAIRARGAVFTPEDGDRWALARYHALSGVHIQHTVIIHPRLHFPSDVVNALTKSLLPREHVLGQLLLPHTRFMLGLDLAVTHHRRSVLLNSQREIHTCLPLTTEGICAAVGVGRVGSDDRVSYPAYDFWGLGHDPLTRFGRYCAEWQAAFDRFARDVTRSVAPGDAVVARWADAVSSWVPGFPDGRAIFAGETLGRAVGRYLATVSVLHSGDHHSYASIPIEYLPMRIRQPAPDPSEPVALDLDKLVGVEDFFRHILVHKMFFKPVVAESLDEVRYRFTGDAERSAARRFHDDRAALDARWGQSGFPASYEIASSIQY